MVRWELVVAQVSRASKASTLASGGERCRVFWALLPVSSQPVFQDSGEGVGDFHHRLGLLGTPGFDEDCEF